MKKKILPITLILLVALGVGAMIYLNLPKIAARNALAGMADDLLDRAELKPLVRASQKGSFSLSADIDTNAMYEPIYGDFYIGEELDLSFDGKLYFGKKSLFLKNASLELNGFEMQADLYIGKKHAYLESDLTGSALGMIKGDMTEALKNSELAREMPPELYRKLLSLMKEYDGISEEPKKSKKSLLLEHLAELILCVEKNADYKSEIREVLLQGERVKCRVITATLDSNGIKAVLRQLSESLEDEDLCAAIDQYGDVLNDLSVSLGVLSENAWIKSPSAHLRQWLDEELERLESTDANAQTMIEIVTPRFSSKLLSLRVSDGDNSLFALDFGKEGAEKTDCITVSVGKASYTYSISRRDESGYVAELFCTQESRERVSLFLLSVDKDTERFSVVWRSGDTERTLTGKWIENKKSTTVIAEQFTDREGNLIDEGFHVELTVAVKDTMPKPLGKKEVRNLFDLTTDEIWEIITKSRGLWELLL